MFRMTVVSSLPPFFNPSLGGLDSSGLFPSIPSYGLCVSGGFDAVGTFHKVLEFFFPLRFAPLTS